MLSKKIEYNQSLSKGTAYLFISQATFIFSSYFIHIFIGRLFTTAEYGLFSLCLYFATTFNLILTWGIPQAVSKYVSEDKKEAESILLTSIKFSILLSSVLMLVILTKSEEMALLFNDPALSPYLRLMSLMFLPYGLLLLISGYYNGMRAYFTQSALMIFYNISKPILIILFILGGFSIKGALLGFVISPIMPLLIGLYIVDLKSLRSVKDYSFKKIIYFAIPILLYSSISNLITSLDLFLIKRLLMNDELVGLYSASSTIAKIPCFLVAASVSAAVFPMISNSVGDSTRVREYIHNSLRQAILFIAPITFMIAACSGSLISLVYSEAYRPAGPSLAILVIGTSIYGISSLLSIIISAAGKPNTAMIISMIILIIDLLLNKTMIPIWGIMGAATATGIANLIGIAILAIYTYMKFWTAPPPSRQ